MGIFLHEAVTSNNGVGNLIKIEDGRDVVRTNLTEKIIIHRI